MNARTSADAPLTGNLLADRLPTSNLNHKIGRSKDPQMCPSQDAHQAVPLRPSGVAMSKHESRSLAFGAASEIPPSEGRMGSQACRPPILGEIGFVGLGRMGTAMAANLAAAGRRVIAYVRREDQIGKLEALGLRPTTDIGDLLHCEVVISMLPDDDAVREIVFGRSDIDLDGLAAGMMPGAIHLSMSTISTAAASLLAS